MLAGNRESSLKRVSRAELDLRFRGPVERLAARTSYGLARAAGTAARVGMVMIVGGVPFIPIGLGLLSITLGLITTIAASAAKLLAFAVALPVAAVRARKLARGAGAARLRGRVRAIRVVRSPAGEDAIAFRIRITRNGRGAEIERAESFLLDDGEPTPALILVQHLYLVDSPRSATLGNAGLPIEAVDLLPSNGHSTECHEVLLREGDAVEIKGLLEHEIDPTLSTLFREVPLRRVMTGTDALPLTVRRVPEG